MENTVFKSSLFIVLACTFLCIAFSSCDNFMNAGSIRREIEESIVYNNAPSCTLIIKAQSEPNQPSIGEFLSDGEKVCKQGYTIDVQFTLNTKYYIYRGMKAVSKTSDAIDRSEYVEFTDISSQTEKDNGIYKVRIKLLKCSNDIKIIPVCILQPKPEVVSRTPSNSSEEQYANVPIVINFSLPMDDSIVNKVNITLYGAPLDEYFETPVLSADKKTLTIRTKKDALMDFINTRKVPYDDIFISFDEGIIVTTEYGDFPFNYENSSFTVRYIGQQEHKAPDRHDFFVTPVAISLTDNIISNDKKFLEGQIDFDNDDFDTSAIINKVLANTCNGEIYIYGKFLDAETGVSSIKIEETFLYDQEGGDYIEDTKSPTYTSNSEDAEFVTDKNGLTSFCIKYKLGYEAYEYEDGSIDEAFTPSGAYSLTVTVEDAAENASQSIEYSVFVINQDDIPETDYLTNQVTDYIGKTAQEYAADLKNIRIYSEDLYDEEDHCLREALPTKVFCNVYMPLSDITLVCEYEDITGAFLPHEFTFNTTDPDCQFWELDLNVKSLADLKVNIYEYFNDCLVGQRQFAFPALYDFTILRIEEEEGSYFNRPYDDVRVIFKSQEHSAYAIGLNKETGKIEELSTYGMGDIRAYKGSDWYFIPQFKYLYGEMLDFVQLQKDFENNDLTEPEIISHSYEHLGIDYQGNDIVKITITIAPDSWEKFDEIQIEMHPWTDEYDRFMTKGEYTFTYFNSCLTFSDVTFDLNGIKGINTSPYLEYVVPQIENAQVLYDYSPPSFIITLNDDGTYKMYLDDGDGSGCKQGLAKIGQNEYPLTQSNEFTHTVSASVLYDNTTVLNGYNNLQRVVSVHYETEDINGNTDKSSTQLKFPGDPASKVKDYISYSEGSQSLSIFIGRDYSIKTRNYTYYHLPINISSYDKNSKNWTSITTNQSQLIENSYNPSTPNIYYTYSAYFNGLPTDKFITVIAGETAPLYYYLGTKNSGLYDYVMKNGVSTSSVIISSDAPVFVHTMVTSIAYDDCKSWTNNTWEFFATEKDAQVYDFTPVQTEITLANDETMTLTERKQPMVYTIPVSGLLSGQSYCVIAHYANGTYEMSEVMQK